MNTLKNDYRVAAIQTVSSTDPVSNMQDAATLIAHAADDSAQPIALPEYFCFMGRKDTDKLSLTEPPGNGPIQALERTSKRLNSSHESAPRMPSSACNNNKTEQHPSQLLP